MLSRIFAEVLMPSGWWLLPVIVIGVVLWIQIILWLFA